MTEISLSPAGFSLPEVLSLVGLIQCVYLAVHIAFRFGRIPGAILPFSYFFLLGLAFLADFGAERLHSPYYFYAQWALWFSGPPLSVLLVIQLTDLARKPALGDLWVLLLLPLGAVLSVLAAARVEPGCALASPCPALLELLGVTGLMAGAISLLLIFSRRVILDGLQRQKFGRVRYWLVFCIVGLNTLFLAAMLAHLAGRLAGGEALMIRNILGLGFVYLVSTGFLRVFPYEAASGARSGAATVGAGDLSAEERAIARRIEDLLNLEKVYQEPSYARADLARECAVPESTVSRVINAHFGKSFPQLINERRVEDARRLLLETDAPVQVVCTEVGFNSLASFNRVFREITGESPGQFRKKSLPPAA